MSILYFFLNLLEYARMSVWFYTSSHPSVSLVFWVEIFVKLKSFLFIRSFIRLYLKMLIFWCWQLLWVMQFSLVCAIPHSWDFFYVGLFWIFSFRLNSFLIARATFFVLFLFFWLFMFIFAAKLLCDCLWIILDLESLLKSNFFDIFAVLPHFAKDKRYKFICHLFVLFVFALNRNKISFFYSTFEFR